MKRTNRLLIVGIILTSLLGALFYIAQTPISVPKNTASGTSSTLLNSQSSSSNLQSSSQASSLQYSLSSSFALVNYTDPQKSTTPPTQRSSGELAFDIQYAQQQFYVAQASAQGGQNLYYSTDNNMAIAMSAWAQQEQFHLTIYQRNC